MIERVNVRGATRTPTLGVICSAVDEAVWYYVDTNVRLSTWDAVASASIDDAISSALYESPS